MGSRLPRKAHAPAAVLLVAAGTLLAPAALLAQDVPGAPADPVEHFRTLRRADSLYAAGRYAEAAPLYRDVAEADPRNGEALFRQARGLFERGRVEEALELLEESVGAGWFSEADVAFEVARAMAGVGREEAAVRWARRAVDAGFDERPSLKGEAFSSLHDDPEFRRIAGLPPAGDADRETRWRHDLEFLRAEARRLHASPERPTHDPGWNARVDALKSEVADLADAEIAVRVQGLLAALGDGHTVFAPESAEKLGIRTVPLRFYFFSDGLFVIDADEAHQDLVGRQVVAIGERTVDGLVDDLRPWVSRDNRWGLLWVGPFYLRSPAFLRAMGYADSVDRAILTLEDGSGRREEVTVEVGPGADGFKLDAPPDTPPDQAPRWLRRMDENYWSEALADRDAVYAQLNQVRDADGGSLADFAAELQRTLAAGDGRHLILDLRHNNGGNNLLIWPLVRTVMHHEARDPANRTWVLVGRNTFSAAQNLVNFLERETEAVFAGEPTSSKPNFTGESSSVELPWSGFRASISTLYWQDSVPWDDRPWIPVAVPVSLSSEDWLGGRDPVLEVLFRILAED